MRNLRKSQLGLSLVELMVALLIGVILTSGVISVYITSKASYSMNAGLGQVQEAGRFALQKIQPLLVLAGNFGCYSPPQGVTISSFLNSRDPVYQMRFPVYGFEYNGNSVDTGTGQYYDDSSGAASNSPTVDNTGSDWSPALSTEVATALHGYAVRYSDVLLIHEEVANPPPATIDDDTGGNAGTWTYASTNAPAMAAGQILIASNCNKEISALVASAVDTTAHTISHSLSYGGTPGNSAAPGGTTNAPWNQFTTTAGGGMVGPAQTYIFFVGKSPIDGGTSLFEVSLETSGANVGKLGTPVEIVPGVENMQVLYGVDTDNDKVPNEYETASTIDAASLGKCPLNTATTAGNCLWQSVVSVRVALIVHSDPNSVDAAPASTTAIHMLGTSYADSFSYKPYADRRMRRYFAQTFSLRNSLP